MNEDTTPAHLGSDNDARYASFFHHHPHATYALDRAGYYTDANRVALEMTGLTLAQLRQTHFTEVIHPEDVPLVRAAFERALGGTASVVEARVLRDTGELVDFRTTGIPLVVGGEVVGVHGVTEDITESRRVLRELEVANEQLEEASAAKTLLLGNVSHEIRTPLSAIIGATELLLETPLDSTSTQLAHMIQRNGERLLRLVDDLLTFSRLASHRLSLQRRPVDVRALVDGVAEWAGPLASYRGLSISFLVDDSVPATVVGDAPKIEHVVGNLVQNAIKFTDVGGVHVRVLTEEGGEEARSGPWLAVHVTDSGIGIAADRLASIFEPFTQVDPSATRAYEGAGLGLAVCRDLADLMGGQLLTESSIGTGTTVILRFPLAGPHDQA